MCEPLASSSSLQLVGENPSPKTDNRQQISAALVVGELLLTSSFHPSRTTMEVPSTSSVSLLESSDSHRLASLRTYALRPEYGPES